MDLGGGIVFPTVHRPACFLLSFCADVELVPSTFINLALGVVEKFARAVDIVAAILKGDLQGPVFWVVVKVNLISVATSGRRVTACKNRRP